MLLYGLTRCMCFCFKWNMRLTLLRILHVPKLQFIALFCSNIALVWVSVCAFLSRILFSILFTNYFCVEFHSFQWIGDSMLEIIFVFPAFNWVRRGVDRSNHLLWVFHPIIIIVDGLHVSHVNLSESKLPITSPSSFSRPSSVRWHSLAHLCRTKWNVYHLIFSTSLTWLLGHLSEMVHCASVPVPGQIRILRCLCVCVWPVKMCSCPRDVVCECNRNIGSLYCDASNYVTCSLLLVVVYSVFCFCSKLVFLAFAVQLDIVVWVGTFRLTCTSTTRHFHLIHSDLQWRRVCVWVGANASCN